MPARRILSLWFPRLAAERALRRWHGLPPGPLAVVAETGGAQILASLNAEAEAAGLRRGQPLRDALAICSGLITRPADPPGEAAFLDGLARWAGRFSPWVAAEPPEGLVLDITGCAHLFGGEEGMIDALRTDCGDLGLSLRAGLADTRGAAWALARFAGVQAAPHRSGDAIAQEARATRARAAKRAVWQRRPDLPQGAPPPRIAPPGQTRAALAPLPLAALRLPPDMVEGLARLGLRQVGDVLGLPRAPLVRRFGRDLPRRIDQALGIEAEPVSPLRPAPRFAVRLTLPDPIGLEADILAGIDRLLPALCARLAEAGRGARRVRLQALRCDHGVETVELGLAQAVAQPERIRPLLALKLRALEAGPGIDRLRLEAPVTEPVHARQHAGHAEAARDALARGGAGTALADLIGRIGARVGLDALTRVAPAESHIPEKGWQVLAAAWSEPAADWPARTRPRPLLLFPPEPVTAPDRPAPPDRFRWRRRDFASLGATGPERIAPEWWLDDPAWRSGPRDYWRVDTAEGLRLWLYYAHGGEMSSGWFCQGQFA
ncbi:DNA polymerase Y family protein [Rhodovulum tesquicola]|uniref:Y-family DNA polymerase n=1 Tax=Rhodovulum tesquicola TaxID=540254 RepID=UPI002098001E|nr:DNA polymerase Y family protein [Rhodovulum tesquicola]MCO8144760.1 DNA polymerase Y family protein [Rhodovulum tesquicola]